MANTYGTDVRDTGDRRPGMGRARTNRWTWIVLAIVAAAVVLWALSRAGERSDPRMNIEAPGEMERSVPEQPAPR